ncbi:PREDICTED: uncharacterized protein LOC105504029 [Colobus angolensis palliatus]|uniref:uncharacterized protein LOC105504029 n=1 Tax=Colobus angolensis palliatus TaxID=336983 RepID=UPI0005F4C59D|nr:PREDICTED: uncharacterized protein LOC105504029 [Colobus angolensis palliatus]XP_011786620.1 PREDICTED: uncharacterized protein LOC105504029 [Colobus angolensis palliatus]
MRLPPERGGARRLCRRVEPAPRRRKAGPGSGAWVRGGRKGGHFSWFRASRPVPVFPRPPLRALSRARPGRPPGQRFPEPAPSRPRDRLMSSAHNFPLPGPSRGPESSPPPAPTLACGVCLCRARPRRPGLTSGWQGLELPRAAAPWGQDNTTGGRGQGSPSESGFEAGATLCRPADLGQLCFQLSELRFPHLPVGRRSANLPRLTGRIVQLGKSRPRDGKRTVQGRTATRNYSSFLPGHTLSSTCDLRELSSLC